jgi:hypothetical protein
MVCRELVPEVCNRKQKLIRFRSPQRRKSRRGRRTRGKRAFGDGHHVVRPVPEARDVFLHRHARRDVCLQHVFLKRRIPTNGQLVIQVARGNERKATHFIEKQDERRLREERVAHDLAPELERVLL